MKNSFDKENKLAYVIYRQLPKHLKAYLISSNSASLNITADENGNIYNAEILCCTEKLGKDIVKSGNLNDLVELGEKSKVTEGFDKSFGINDAPESVILRIHNSLIIYKDKDKVVGLKLKL